MLAEANGVDGRIELLEDKIVIKRRGYPAFKDGLKEDREVPVMKITSIQFKKASMAINGYIQLNFIEDQQTDDDQSGNENNMDSVMFNQRQEPAFEEFRLAVEDRIASVLEDPRKASGEKSLEVLEKLYKKGIITADQYDVEKKRILGLS